MKSKHYFCLLSTLVLMGCHLRGGGSEEAPLGKPESVAATRENMIEFRNRLEYYTVMFSTMPDLLSSEFRIGRCGCAAEREHFSYGYMEPAIAYRCRLAEVAPYRFPDPKFKIPMKDLKVYVDPYGEGLPYLSAWSEYRHHVPIMLISRGPDGDVDVGPGAVLRDSEGIITGVMPDTVYDPTNGAMSSGDIVVMDWDG